MDIIGTIITGLKTIIGAIYPPLKKKFFDQPKIYFVFKYQNSSKKPRGLSPANDTSQPIDNMKAIYLNDLHWNYKMVLRNNSEYNAYNINLLKPKPGHNFNLEQKIDALKPLLSNAEIEYTIGFYEFYEGLGKVAGDMAEKPPSFLRNEKFVLQYTNVKGKKFYTVFDMTQEEDLRNQFFKKYKT